VTIIRAGRAIETGTLDELRHLARTTIDAELDASVDLTALPRVHDLTVSVLAGGGLRVRCQVENDALTAVLGHLTGAGVRRLVCRPPTLEELFLRHYPARTMVTPSP